MIGSLVGAIISIEGGVGQSQKMKNRTLFMRFFGFLGRFPVVKGVIKSYNPLCFGKLKEKKTFVGAVLC
jgi:hypothetical protein